jgi:hypothetical protein
MRSILVGLLLGISVALAAIIGPTDLPWHWGPALLALAGAFAARALLPAGNEKPLRALSPWVWLPLVPAAGWIAIRAVISPVPTLANHDLVLLLACAAGFWLGQDIALRDRAVRVFAAVLAAVVTAHFAVAVIQLGDPEYFPIRASRPTPGVSGFFGHYIFFAHFMAAAALFLAGLACFGRGAVWWRGMLAVAAAMAVAGVFFSNARGGALALAGGAAVFGLLSMLVLKQQKSRAFPLVAISVPVILLAGIAFIPRFMSYLQSARGLEASAAALLDNDARWRYFSLAADCISRHPWTGGGSRSYSWENYASWSAAEDGWMAVDIVYAHNEILQAATDYGLVGAGLIILAIGVVMIRALVFRINLPPAGIAKRPAGAMVGAMAAVSAMLLESMFSFAFHFLPVALFLGCCLGILAGGTRMRVESSRAFAGAGRIGGRLAAVVGLVMAGTVGMRTTKALAVLWPIESEGVAAVGDAASRMAAAEAIWPSHELALRRGTIWQARATADATRIDAEALDEAVAAYSEAHRLHPYNPAITINLANILSLATRWEESERWFQKTHELQGGVYAAFGTRYFYAMHLARRGWHARYQRNPSLALGYFEAALADVDSWRWQIPLGIDREATDEFRRGLVEVIGFLKGARVEPLPVRHLFAEPVSSSR